MSSQHPAARWANDFAESTTELAEFDVDGEPTDLPPPYTVKGILSVVYVESLKYYYDSVRSR